MNAIITGTTQGLGLQLARQLRDSRRVFCVNRRASGQPEEILADLASPAGVKSAIERLDALLDGEQQVVEFYLNAAIYGTDERLGDAEPSGVAAVMYTNVFGQLAIIEHLLERGVAVKLVAVSSSMGSIQLAPEPYHYTYGSSKAALNLSVRLLASRQSGLSYLLIDPGWMKTQMGGEQAPEDPAEVAAQILHRAADQHNWNRADGMVQAQTGKILPW